MVYVLAVAAALANALTSILQRMGVEDAPGGATLKLSLLLHACASGIWLAGFGLMVAVLPHAGGRPAPRSAEPRCSRSSPPSCSSWC